MSTHGFARVCGTLFIYVVEGFGKTKMCERRCGQDEEHFKIYLILLMSYNGIPYPLAQFWN